MVEISKIANILWVVPMNYTILTNHLPEFVKKELETIYQLILPLGKKRLNYTLWAVPLIGVPMITLFYVVFVAREIKENIFLLLFYLSLGTIGLLFYKKGELSKKEIQQVTQEYIKTRVRNSVFVSDSRKEYYIRLAEKVPKESIDHFIRFLEEEERYRSLKQIENDHVSKD